MANKIPIEITGDKTLARNVEQAKKIEKSIAKAYEDWKKISAGKGASANIDKTVQSMKKMTAESKKVNTEISKQTSEQKRLDKALAEYNTTLKKSNQIQTSYANDLQKTNVQIEVLKKNQKLLKAQGKETSAQYIKNKTAIKSLSAEYRKMEKEKLQDIQLSKTLRSLDKKQNLTLKEQKQLFSALNIQYNRLVTSEGKASKSTRILQKRMDKLNKSILRSEKAVRMHQRNVGNYPKSMGKMGGAITGVGVALAGVTMLIRSGITAMNRYIEMANAQALSEKKLTVIMQQRMGATNNQIQSILDLTRAQQGLGVVGDEVQLAGAQQLSTFLKQTDSLEQLIPAMNNLIVQQKGMNGTQQNAVMIANLFGKVMDGQVSALTRVGISLTDAQKEMIIFGTESEKAKILSQVITDNVGNMNEAFAQTDAGRLQQAKNILGDFGEEIGANFLPILANLAQGVVKVIQFFKDFATKIKELDFIKKLGKAFKNVFNEIGTALGFVGKKTEEGHDKFAKLEGAVKVFSKVLTFLLNVTKIAIRLIAGLVKGVVDTAKWFVRAGKNVVEFSKKIATKMNKAAKNGKETFIEFNKKILDFGKSIAQGTTKSEGFNKVVLKIREGIKKVIEKFKEIISKIRDFGKMIYEGKTPVENYNKVILKTKKVVGDVIDFIKTKFTELKDFMQPTIDAIVVKIQPLINTITNLLRAVGLLKQSTKNVGGSLGDLRDIGIGANEVDGFLDFFDQYTEKMNEANDLNNAIDLTPIVDEGQLSDNLSNLQDFADEKTEIAEAQLIKEITIYENLYNKYQQYLEHKNLANEKEILLLQKNGADELEIEYTKLQQKKDLLTEYLIFLQANANEENEIERLQLQNQLLDVENQLSDFTNKLPSDENTIKKILGLTDENIAEIKSLFKNLTNSIFEFLINKENAEIEALNNKRELLKEEQAIELERINSRRQGLDIENKLRDEDFANTALLTESLIRESEKRIEAKRLEEQELLKIQKEKERELKLLQKRAIWTQFALDNASAISSIIKYAMANPLNSITGGLAGISQIALMTAPVIANFIKAKSLVRGLKDGDVLIDGDGTETSDSILVRVSKNESVINAKGSKKAPNLLRGLNANVSGSMLMQMLAMDLGLNGLQQHNVLVSTDSFELRKQNEILKDNYQEIKQNNIYLQQLLYETKNKADFVSIPNGYKKITKNGEIDYIYE